MPGNCSLQLLLKALQPPAGRGVGSWSPSTVQQEHWCCIAAGAARMDSAHRCCGCRCSRALRQRAGDTRVARRVQAATHSSTTCPSPLQLTPAHWQVGVALVQSTRGWRLNRPALNSSSAAVSVALSAAAQGGSSRSIRAAASCSRRAIASLSALHVFQTCTEPGLPVLQGSATDSPKPRARRSTLHTPQTVAGVRAGRHPVPVERAAGSHGPRKPPGKAAQA